MSIYGCSFEEKRSYSVRPVRRPLAVALNNIHELPSNDAISLLAWVQLIKPHERVRARVCSAVHIHVACDVERRSTIEVVGRVVVNVRQLWHRR